MLLAQVGVATANLFPQFNITGNFGWETSFLHNYLPNSAIWAIVEALYNPCFAAVPCWHRGGKPSLPMIRRLQYRRQTVLTAFQNVADRSKAIETDARTLGAATCRILRNKIWICL